MRYNLTVNSIKGLNSDNHWHAGFYSVLEAMGFMRSERWPTGSLSAWSIGHVKEAKVDWTTLFEIAKAFDVEMEIKSEHS